MRAQELRQAWTAFWSERQHTDVPSAGLIPLHPSAPMFTNSGMMPFVPYFVGEERVPWDPARVSSIQRCVRAGGKHNDLDEIGRSPRHLSFFEMLGNFSFGDYFKREAIRWAWDFSIDVMKIDPDRIWVTVHVDDDEAESLWVDEVGFPRERIQRLDADNFWEMGETGPCGPSSELFYDFGPAAGPDGGPANPAAEHRYVEYWNLVFQQYFRRDDGSLRELASQNIDTGAGLERLLAVSLGEPSVWVTDEIASLVGAAENLTGVRLGSSDQGDIALKILADHARTMSFLVADGVVPSNEERGFVLRRIIRRAVRFAYLLGVEKPIAPALAEHTIELMGEAHPVLEERADRITGTLAREEEAFRRTLRSGLSILDHALDELPDHGELPGSVAFRLHDTYGFPFEVTAEIVEDRGYGLDRAGFDVAMEEQRARARSSAKTGAVAAGDEADAFAAVLAESGTTEFVGRDLFEVDAHVVGIVPADDGTIGVFLDRTPFYAESGGQVGDTGTLTADGFDGRVVNTAYALPGLVRHIVEFDGDTPSVGDVVTAAIDVGRRDAIRRNHTATHLLHWGLREILGDHVQQQGSLVAPDRLRFDFGHHEAVTPEQIRRIEDLVNTDILANHPVRHFETTQKEAAGMGAIAFFGEKYGEIVSVLEAGPHSLELCGGTHVRRTGDIGPLKIVSESSIGSNLRRIEAVTGTGPIDILRGIENRLHEAADLLGVPVNDLVTGIRKRLDGLDELRNTVASLRSQLATSGADDLAASADHGVVVARVDDLPRDGLRDLAVAVRDRADVRAVILIGAPEGGGVALVAAVRPDSGFDAGALIADAAKTVRGGGGKHPEIAVAGGRDVEAIDAALEVAREAVRT